MVMSKGVSSSYTIRQLESSDVNAVVDFQGEYYGRSLADDFYRWKYFQNPICPSRVWIAETQGKLIGMAAVTFKRLKINDATFLCGELGDFLVHSDYRLQGIFTALVNEICTQSLADGAKIFYVRPGDPSFPGLLRLGFQEVFRLTQLTTVFNVRNVLRRKISNPLLLNVAWPFAQALARMVFHLSSGGVASDFEISRVSCFDDSIDELWERVAKRHQTIVVRDKKYVNWRYAENPRNYTIYVAKRDHSPVGYTVISQQRYHTGLLHGYFVDILTDPDCPELTGTLMSRALEDFRKNQVDLAHSWVIKTSELCRTFKTYGWRVVFGDELHFVIRTHNLPRCYEEQLKAPGTWFLTTGETDGV